MGNTTSFAMLGQDLERLKFASDLRENPEQYKAYVDQRVDALTGEVFNRKRAAFQKAQIDIGRYMDMDHNVNYYKMRNGDIQRLTTSMEANNRAVKDKLETDLELSKRQFEINEWQNHNKLETLFFLQVFFIASLAMAIIIFLQKNAAITTSMASLLTALLLGIVVVIGVYRYYYTRRTRDNRLWHRRYFGTAKAPSNCSSCKNNQLSVDLNCALGVSKDATACAEEKAYQFGRWQRDLQKEMLAYQEAGTDPAAIINANNELGCSSEDEQKRMLQAEGITENTWENISRVLI
jgi:hypothetical protein